MDVTVVAPTWDGTFLWDLISLEIDIMLWLIAVPWWFASLISYEPTTEPKAQRQLIMQIDRSGALSGGRIARAMSSSAQQQIN